VYKRQAVIIFVVLATARCLSAFLSQSISPLSISTSMADGALTRRANISALSLLFETVFKFAPVFSKAYATPEAGRLENVTVIIISKTLKRLNTECSFASSKNITIKR
jgi:hypothetical protein